MIINASICLNDVPKEKIWEKDGKKYLLIEVVEKKEPDKYGKTHYVSLRQTKEERESGAKRIYVGNGKVVNFDKDTSPIATSPTSTNVPSKDEDNNDKLPF